MCNLKTLAVATLIATLLSVPVSAQEDPAYLSWSVEKVKSIANKIRASNSLNPHAWKDDSKVAVLFSVDVDNELGAFTLYGTSGVIPEGAMSYGEYGANEGLPRIIKVLKKDNIPATFFIPAMMLEIHPETVTQVQRLGNYEIGIHGWIHEYNAGLSSFDVEKKLVEKSINLLQEKFGERPVGYRAPSWNFSNYTLDVIKSLGFTYDSSLMARDDPYMICERNAAGVSQSSGILELPVSWILDDYPLLSMRGRIYSTPRDVLQVYKDEFDRAYEEGGVFTLAMHPSVIGRRSRIMILEELINYMKTKAGVWFATHAEVAKYVLETKSNDIRCLQ